MTEPEKAACAHLKNSEGPDVIDDSTMSLADRLKEKSRKCKAGERDRSGALYKNVDFIPGSAAEVERLWLMCQYFLTTQRAKMTPILFEAIMFLRINHEYWDIHLVVHAYSMVIKDARTECLEAKICEAEDFNAVNSN